MAIIEDVLNSALGLPVEERAVLAERRLAAYRRGMAGARPAEDVYARVEQLLRG